MRRADASPQGSPGWAALLADPAHGLVAVDFDGTLSAIVDRPQDARPVPGALEALTRVAAVVGSVAVLTGRAALTAVELGGFDRWPGLEGLVILGQYGAERWQAGELTHAPPPPGLAEARAALAAMTLPDGVEVEDKGIALGVHVRRSADPGAAAAALSGPLADLARRTGLVVEPGRLVLELRAPGMDKGAALLAFVAERGARSVLYAGDDLGDLAAFAAVRALREQGIPGLTVCVASAEVSELALVADVVVDGPPGAVALLEALADGINRD